jgi:hypothetical protein
MPYVNHDSFHILDEEWGPVTIQVCGQPPFKAMVMLNGHESTACRARQGPKQRGNDLLVGLGCRRPVILTDGEVGPTAFQDLSRC